MTSILDTLDRPHKGKTRPRPRMHPAVRIERGSALDAETGCLVWQRNLSNMGYGLLSVTQVGYPTLTFTAHRASYELAKGRVPEGLVLDHLCRNRACVNPDHMEAVRQRENVMRSPIAMGALNAAKTHCAQGHPYSPENTYVYNRPSPNQTTTRICKTCQRKHVDAYRARKAAAKVAKAS